MYAKKYVESGWLGDIYNCDIGSVQYVKAAVSPSQPGVGRVDYSALQAISDGSILTAYCSCPSGAGRSCSHVAAIAY